MFICRNCDGNGCFISRCDPSIPIIKRFVTCRVCDGLGTIGIGAPKTISLHTFISANTETNEIRVNISDFPENAIMAHVAVKVGLFPSLTQARKNGIQWLEPIHKCEFMIRKKTVKVIVK